MTDSPLTWTRHDKQYFATHQGTPTPYTLCHSALEGTWNAYCGDDFVAAVDFLEQAQKEAERHWAAQQPQFAPAPKIRWERDTGSSCLRAYVGSQKSREPSIGHIFYEEEPMLTAMLGSVVGQYSSEAEAQEAIEKRWAEWWFHSQGGTP